MTSRPLLILDFDRTLFSEVFYERFVRLMDEHNLLPESVVEDLLVTIKDPEQTIDLLTPLKKAGVDTDKALSIAGNELTHESVLYADVPEFLERHTKYRIIILTTGVDLSWQEAKLSLCPELKDFKKILIYENKGRYILDNLKRQSDKVSLSDLEGEWFDRIVLVDDRVDALIPLIGTPSVELWQVERPGAKYQRTQDHEGIHHVTSLKEIHIA
jgi:hypothetical protein